MPESFIDSILDPDAPWNYFGRDHGYSNVLKQRLDDAVAMDSAKALGGYLDIKLRGDLDIVDFGGGPGHYYPVLRDAYRNGTMRYTSVDIDAENIAYGDQHFASDPNAQFVVGSALEPAELLEGHNGVISANTLPHIPTIEPIFSAMQACSHIRFFLFRMLLGSENIEIRKHLSATDFDGMFARGYQHNNIYSLPYLQSLMGNGWQLEQLPDVQDHERLAQHAVPMQDHDAAYANRVSRPVGDMVFKGDIYMPWGFVFGQRRA